MGPGRAGSLRVDHAMMARRVRAAGVTGRPRQVTVPAASVSAAGPACPTPGTDDPSQSESAWPISVRLGLALAYR